MPNVLKQTTLINAYRSPVFRSPRLLAPLLLLLPVAAPINNNNNNNNIIPSLKDTAAGLPSRVAVVV
jgi:hypothetical protein